MNSSTKINIFLFFITILLLISFYSSSYSYEIDSKSNKKTDFETENILFQFMRDNYRLESYAAGLGLKITEKDDNILKNLPRRDLFHKLKNKLTHLAIQENEKAAISQESITREMQKVMAQLILGTDIGFDLTLLLFREKFKKYPNTADLVTLAALSIHDAKDTYELLNGINKETHKNTDPKNTNTEIVERVFKNTVDGYYHFIEHNKETLDLISQFADEGFLIKDPEETCIQFFGFKHCKKAKNKNLKAFSEIMPYIKTLQNSKKIETS